ncbi:cytidylyltransferase domain-containing protein [Acetobacterium sp. KB-1]|uniref:acylneuraminate cytidylyltransferase family protein n=1 Tax=Acetobacterium sp. KB-1 TaxID=2184575 RepID=UPI000DBEC964|nr:acylneuraminate cytidylyltransferase family protein [Acetobacterium sp. KB-1]AWW26386.1 CMP-N-acetlyneuraminic acid synthetase [Acetobacterium sp. KB-1]
MNRLIGIIPARSGSKGLEDKNIKILNGKPLIAYTIETALKSKVFDKLIVSTDSQEYAEISRFYGAEVPFLRPKYLSGDEAATNDVIVDIIERLEACGEKYDSLMILQPTSPLRRIEDIVNSINLLNEKSANAIISLCEMDHSPVYAGLIPEDLRIDGFIKKGISSRRQDLPRYYHPNGAIYLAKVNYFMEHRDLYQDKCYAYIMNKRNSIDIDDQFDFEFVEFIMKNSIKGE